MFNLSFNSYTGEDSYWRSSLLVAFDTSVRFLCSGDQVCLNAQYSIGNYCINHSFDSAAIKELDEGLDDWLNAELITLDAKCPTILTAVHAEKYHYVSELEREGIKVAVITTAGIKSNAVNVHHDRSLHEQKINQQSAKIGTINIVLCTNINLTEAAMAQALGIVYESKAALFYDKGWKSSYSNHIATGTGTDSVIIASSTNTDITQTNYAGSHSIFAGMVSELIRSSIECSVNRSRAIQGG